MWIGESSMPSLLSFKEDNRCQKPSSTELCIGANCSKGSIVCCFFVIVDLSLLRWVPLQRFSNRFQFFNFQQNSSSWFCSWGFNRPLQSTMKLFVFIVQQRNFFYYTCWSAHIGSVFYGPSILFSPSAQ